MKHYLIKRNISDSIKIKQELLQNNDIMVDIIKVADLIVEAFNKGNKLLLCGNGGSAADAQHLAAEFLIRLTKNVKRKSYPVIPLALDTSTLTACGNDIGFDGKKINSINKYKIFGTSVDQLINDGVLKKPNYIKIDVDGLEHYIISGGRSIISKASEILLEVNDKFLDQNKKVNYFLNEAGFKLDKKVYAHPQTKGVSNQIWIRKI